MCAKLEPIRSLRDTIDSLFFSQLFNFVKCGQFFPPKCLILFYSTAYTYFLQCGGRGGGGLLKLLN